VGAVLAWIANTAPLISLVALVVGGLWALLRLREPDLVARGDRATAFRLAALVAAGLGLIGALIGVAFTSFFGGEANVLFGIVVSVVVAALTLLGSLAGYAMLARRSIGSIALVGVLLGPILVAGPIVLSTVARSAGDRAYIATEVAEAEARGQIFSLTIQDVRSIRDDQGDGLQRVEVDATLHTTVDFALDAPDVWPSFVIVPVGAEDIRAQSNSTGRVPSAMAAGTDLAVTLRFPAYRLSPDAWRLRALLMGPGGQYSVTVPLTIPE
jgi:hypothetical protein